MTTPTIEVSHVTKEFRLGAQQSLKQALRSAGARLLGRSVPQRPLFKALDDVSFTVQPGEVVGIIGHNGAGKSTLLKMLARISTPTHGAVKVNGRIAPLIEVGAGFVPDFTGRENVYLNGAILGMKKAEIDRKFDEIVDFAEMAEFIDTPVKRYSSGMQVKLAFAVATSIESEILIVDEVLAVGDLAFQRKCFDRMEDLIKRQGRTVLLVSHNIRQVQRLCSRTLLLDRGRVALNGEPKEVCDRFYAINDRKINSDSSASSAAGHIGSGELDFLGVSIINGDGITVSAVPYQGDCEIVFRFLAKQPLEDLTFGFGVHTTDFIYLTTCNSEGQVHISNIEPGLHEVRCHLRKIPLLPGAYPLRFGVTSGAAARTVFYAENIARLQIDGSVPITTRDGFFSLDYNWKVPQRIGTNDVTAIEAIDG